MPTTRRNAGNTYDSGRSEGGKSSEKAARSKYRSASDDVREPTPESPETPEHQKTEAVPKVTFRQFMNLLGHTHPPVLAMIVALLLSLVTTGVGLVVPLFTKELVDGFSLESINSNQIVMIVFAILGQALGSALSTYLLIFVGQKVVANLRDALWRKMLELKVPYYDNKATGDLISRLSNDTAVLRSLIAENLSGFITGIISMVGAISILLYLNWRMTLVMLAAVPLAMAVFIPIGKIMRKISRAMMDENAKFTALLTQVLSEIRLVKASNAEPREYDKGRSTIDRILGFGLKEGRVWAIVSPIMALVMMALLVVIVGYGGVLVASGELTAGDLVAFILYLIQIVMPLSQITGFFTQVQKARGATEHLIGLLENPGEDMDSGVLVEDARRRIEFRRLSFGYGPQSYVIRDMSFTLAPGTVTAIVGPSGSGKTTLFSLLERFYEPADGGILLDNIDIRDFSLRAWRDSIGYVPQDSPLMAGTVRDNICYGVGRSVADEEVREVAHMAFAHDFITALPKGYDTEVGERGIKLSGGQRQRIAIARALLRNPAILMLDEATSSLDSGSEAAVQMALKNLMRGRTTLVIAHRLSTVLDADLILFIEKGKLTGQGTHAELLKHHMLYRTFAKQQLRMDESDSDEAGHAAENTASMEDGEINDTATDEGADKTISSDHAAGSRQNKL